MDKKRLYSLLMAVYLILLVVLSAYDLSFSVEMTKNASGLFVEAGRRIGPLPALLCPCYGVLGLGNNPRQKKISQLIGAALCGGAAYSLSIPSTKEPLSFLLFVLYALLLIYLMSRLPLPEDSRKTRTILWIGIGTVLIGFLLVQIMKFSWGRPRYLAIVQEGAEFREWMAIQGFAFRSDLYRSFPSAHAFCASVSFLLAFLPDLFENMKIRRGTWIVTAAVFTAVISFSRIVGGKHFISDVMAGAGLFLLLLLIAVFINWEVLYGQNQKEDESIHDGAVRP
ncbi:MAG: phosphatase PAP2 family protein [Solobacterium sp.]|nr:phosphatase PAP2 family protein [Solobacterium sp.]